MSGNLSERIFLLDLDFATISILSYNHKIEQYRHIVNYNSVVVKVVAGKFCLNGIF